MIYTFRLIDPLSGAIVAAIRVNAESRNDAEEKGRRALARFRPSRFFWDTVQPAD